jgi:hypothetical protein
MARQSAPVGGNQFQVPEAITMVGVDPDHRLSPDYLTRPRTAPYFKLNDLQGLDLFHGRFAGDRRWNSPGSITGAQFIDKFERLEELYCRDPEFVDHATHLLLVAAPRNQARAEADAMLACAKSASRVHKDGQQVQDMPTSVSEDSHASDKPHGN